MLREPKCSERMCKHYQGVAQPDGTEIGEHNVCAAFPDGIPREISYGDNPHTEPFEGDHGIQFEAEDDPTANYDPDQPRDEDGKWGSGGGSAGGTGLPLPPKEAPEEIKNLYRARQRAYTRMKAKDISDDERAKRTAEFDKATFELEESKRLHPELHKKAPGETRPGKPDGPKPEGKPEKPDAADTIISKTLERVDQLRKNNEERDAIKASREWQSYVALNQEFYKKTLTMEFNTDEYKAAEAERDRQMLKRGARAAHDRDMELFEKSLGLERTVRAEFIEDIKPEHKIPEGRIDTDGLSGKGSGIAKSGIENFRDMVESSAFTLSPRVRLSEISDGRSKCSYEGDLVTLDPRYVDKGTVVHELGHSLEDGNPAVRRAVTEFRDRRTAGEPLVSLKSISGGNYDSSEVTKKDKFFSPYVGKHYPSGHTEVVSMGLERLHRDPIDFAKDDPEYFSLMVRVARGEIN
jgi:hypothetical protein